MEEGFTEEKSNLYSLAVASQDPQEIETARYKLLTDATGLLGLFVNYITLEKSGICFDFGTDAIPKIIKLYQIRAFHDSTDFSSPAAWMPPPRRPQGRASLGGKPWQYGERLSVGGAYRAASEYVLRTYECTEDIEVSEFLGCGDTNELHNLVGIALNAFFNISFSWPPE